MYNDLLSAVLTNFYFRLIKTHNLVPLPVRGDFRNFLKDNDLLSAVLINFYFRLIKTHNLVPLPVRGEKNFMLAYKTGSWYLF